MNKLELAAKLFDQLKEYIRINPKSLYLEYLKSHYERLCIPDSLSQTWTVRDAIQKLNESGCAEFARSLDEFMLQTRSTKFKNVRVW